MDDALIEAAADELVAARDAKRQVAPLRARYRLETAAQAYRVQSAANARWLAGGRRLAGRKIGLTSQAVQAQLGVDEPDFGALWADGAYGDGDTVPAAAFMQPRAEVELAFVLARGLDDPQVGLDEVMRAVAYLAPAVELVDSAIRDWDIKLVDTIADNASAGGFVLGRGARKLDGLDLRLCGGLVHRNGKLASVGVGAACLGDPLNAVLWLARRLAGLGTPLREGDLVLSGAFGPMLPVAAGDVFCAEIAGFAPLHFGFGDRP